MQTRLFLVLSLVLVVTGCSLAGFAYDLVPRLAVRHVDNYLQLNNRQSARALELFRERHQLHAHDELPRYYRLLEDMRSRGDEGMTRADLDAIFDQTRFLYHLAVERTLPAVAQILADVEPAQIDLLEKRLAQDVAKERRRIRKQDREERIENTLDEIKEWVGRLDDPQRERLTASLEEMEDTRELWLEWREGNNRRFIEFLRSKPQPVEIENRLAAYWIKRRDMPAELERRLENNVERYREMLVSFEKTLSDAQRRHARKKLNKYADLIVGIMPDEVRVSVLEGGGSVMEGQWAR